MFPLPDLFVITQLQLGGQYVVWLAVNHAFVQASSQKLSCNACDFIVPGFIVYHNYGISWELDFKEKNELEATRQYALCGCANGVLTLRSLAHLWALELLVMSLN